MFEETLSLIDQVSGPAEKMASTVAGLGETVQKTTNTVVRARDEFGRFTKASSGTSDSLGGVASGFGQTGESAGGMLSGLDALLPGLGAVAAGAVAAASAIGMLIFEGAKFALESAQAKMQLVTTYDALLGFAGAGEKADNMLSDLSRSLPQTKDQLAAWGQQFAAMGVTDLGALQGQLRATASAQALMGDKGATAYTSLSKKIQEAIVAHQGLKISDRQLQSLATTGVNVADVAAKMGVSTDQLRRGLDKGTISADKFGGALQEALIAKGQKPLEAMANSMGAQIAHLKQNFGDMFEDVDPGPFLTGMKDLLSIFDQNTASGRTLKAAVTGFFNGVFSIASKVLPYLKKFFLDLVIFGLKIYIALKPTIAAFKQLFAGKSSGDMFGAMLSFIGLQIKLVALAVAGTIAFFVKMMTIGKQVTAALGDAFSNVAGIVSGFIDGLVNGITGGIGKVVDAAKGLAQGAMNAVKGVLGISSPSKVMMQLGGHTAMGFAGGLDDGAPSIKQSAYGMGQAATAGAGATSAVGSKSGASSGAASSGVGSGATVTFEAGSIVINGAGKSAEELTESMVSLVFERMALEVGL